MRILEIPYQKSEELAAWEPYLSLPQAVKLLDGTVVTIRPIQVDDARRLQAFFGRLSKESMYLRFLAHRRELPYQQALQLSSVDHQTQVALVATREEKAEIDIIAVARYASSRSNGLAWAEPAIVVEDRFQRRGLGVLLLKWLSAYARSQGVRIFRVTVHPNGAQILRLIERSRLPIEKKLKSGLWEITVGLGL